MTLPAELSPLPPDSDILPVGRLILDNKRRVVDVDTAFCRLFSTDLAQVSGRQMDDLCTAKDRQGVDRYLTAIATYQTVPIDLLLSISLGGQDQFCRLRMGKTPIGWTVFLEPIGWSGNDRLYDLAANNGHWRTIIAASSDGIAILNVEGRIVEHNQPFVDLMEFKSEHGVALSDESIQGCLFFKSQKDPAFSPVGAAFGATKLRARRYSGTVLYKSRRLEVELAPTISPASGFLGATLVLRDRTLAAQLDEIKLRAARDAGRSEVATNVLHNVGNVLNSVNVSANVLDEHLRKQRIDGVKKVQLLLAEQIEPLSAALGAERSSRLLSFLDALSTQLVEAQAVALSESARLRENIEHIRAIVSAQQSLAGQGTVTEELSVSDLIEAAIQVSDLLAQRQKIRVVRDFAEISPVFVDRHRTAQILINLLSNARHAVLDSDQVDKQIRICLRRTVGGIQISVHDNGVGIKPENLSRIFQHGFSTKTGGHGFGLHSCANVAREMDGILTVSSDGANMGATFTLEIPFKPDVQSNRS